MSFFSLYSTVFILGELLLNCIIFETWVSNCTLLVYTNVFDFCLLTLYPVMLLNFISFGSYFVVNLLSFLHKLRIGTVLFYPFYSVGLWYFFAWLQWPEQYSGESGHPSLVLDLRILKALSLTIMYASCRPFVNSLLSCWASSHLLICC